MTADRQVAQATAEAYKEKNTPEHKAAERSTIRKAFKKATSET